MRLGTNVTSTSIQRHLGNSSAATSRSTQKLSSGSQAAGENNANSMVSDKLRASIKSTNAARRNVQDGKNFLRVAESTILSTSNAILRLRELFIQGASGILSDSERGFSQKEIKQLQDELVQLVYRSEINGMHFLDGSHKNFVLQVGQSLKDGVLEIDLEGLKVDLENLGLIDLKMDTQKAAQDGISILDNAVDKMSDLFSTMAAIGSRLETIETATASGSTALSRAYSGFNDVDIAEETADLTKAKVLTNTGVAMLAQASHMPSMALKLL